MTKQKTLWFKAKNYGYGWYPATWQGWTVLLVWVALFAGIVSSLNLLYPTGWLAPILSVLIGSLLTAALIAISWKMGERPQWRWGQEDTDQK